VHVLKVGRVRVREKRQMEEEMLLLYEKCICLPTEKFMQEPSLIYNICREISACILYDEQI